MGADLPVSGRTQPISRGKASLSQPLRETSRTRVTVEQAGVQDRASSWELVQEAPDHWVGIEGEASPVDQTSTRDVKGCV